MDDILIHMDGNRDQHRECVHRILEKLEKHDLYLKPEKCLFEEEQVEFLGVVLKNGTIQMDPAKIKGVADWPPPKNGQGCVSVPGLHWILPILHP